MNAKLGLLLHNQAKHDDKLNTRLSAIEDSLNAQVLLTEKVETLEKFHSEQTAANTELQELLDDRDRYMNNLRLCSN